jgi:hypothetical protein
MLIICLLQGIMLQTKQLETIIIQNISTWKDSNHITKQSQYKLTISSFLTKVP